MSQVIEFAPRNPGSRVSAVQFADGDPDKQAAQPGKTFLAHRARAVKRADPLGRRVIQRRRRIPARIHQVSLSAGPSVVSLSQSGLGVGGYA